MKTISKTRIHDKKMIKNNIRFYLYLILIFILSHICDPLTAGCLDIVCDADDVPIYLNGAYLGKTPLNIQCELNPEEYILTFFPPLADSKIRFLDKETYLDILNRSSKSCFIIPGDTVKVFMEWQPVMLELAYLEKEHRRTQRTLMGVAGLIILGFIGVWVTL